MDDQGYFGGIDFNPHSREGSDSRCNLRHITDRYFNPHSREGSDLCQFLDAVHRIISIHTPARGVTHCDGSMGRDQHISIHTPARGVTIRIRRRCRKQTISIHTPARGVTRLTLSAAYEISDFNPHSREGSDGRKISRYTHIWISIHTPARGVTLITSPTLAFTGISIHTPARGVTLQ